jgi:hypothetical protein
MRILIVLAAVSASTVAVATALATPAMAQQTVPLPQFDSVGLHGSGSVTIRRGPQQQVIIREGDATTSEFRVKQGGSLEIDSCRNSCPANYRLSVEIVMPDVEDLAISGSGRISVEPGFAGSANRSFAINGSGEINARSLSANSMHAAINGSGRIRTGNVEHIQAAISGSGRIGYVGKPHVQSAVSGSGWIGEDR